MAAEKTFFSYSRDDSEFVLKLAKDLRDAGINIWLDQLDIPVGKRWDTEIEIALKSSQSQLVILSPSAVASHNCMDEVSYALEEDKRVIPILLEECQIPFRLKRVQRIDFTGDYESAFNKLLKAFDLEGTPAPSITLKELSEQDQKLKERKEETLWQNTAQLKSEEAYQKYLDEYPAGKYKSEAQKALDDIKMQKAQKLKIIDSPKPIIARKFIRKNLLPLLIGFAIVAVTAIIFMIFSSKEKQLTRDKSIAVLPFTTIGEIKENEYFSEGIHDDILTQLAKIKDLKVIARTSVMHYKKH